LSGRAGLVEQLADTATGQKHGHRGHTPFGALMIFNLWASVRRPCAGQRQNEGQSSAGHDYGLQAAFQEIRKLE
jgi:cytochrome b